MRTQLATNTKSKMMFLICAILGSAVIFRSDHDAVTDTEEAADNDLKHLERRSAELEASNAKNLVKLKESGSLAEVSRIAEETARQW